MKTAYSYIRLSSAKQVTEGRTGAARQMSKPESICKQNGWNLSDKTFADLGVSAYKGHNRLKGDLSTFINLAKENKLEKGPVLIIEAFDRFSRQNIDESEPAILELLKAGVDIHVAFNSKTFTKESTKSLVDRIEILVSLKAAFDYSENLSKRIKSSQTIKMAKMLSGEICKHHNAPAYYVWNEDKKQYGQNDFSKVAKRIVNEYRNGSTLYQISNGLNSDNVLAGRSHKKNRWSRMTIKQLLQSKALYGEFLGIPNYFKQPITDKATFDKIQLMLIKNSGNKGKFNSEFINIFKGIAKCGGCGRAMSLGVQKISGKSKKPKAKPYRYFRCSSVSNSMPCDCHSNIDINYVEPEFFITFSEMKPAELFKANKDDKTASQIVTIQLELDTITKRITKLITIDIDLPELKTELADLKMKREALTKELRTLTLTTNEAKQETENFEELRDILKFCKKNDKWEMNEASFKRVMTSIQNVEVRKQIRNILPTIFSKIVFDSKKREWTAYDLSGRLVYTSVVLWENTWD